MNQNDINILIELVYKTLNTLYEKEEYLFKQNASERNLVFHFSRYFIKMLNDELNDSHPLLSDDLSVDCEYNKSVSNKNGKEVTINNKSRKIYPDFIFHKRGYNEKNILAIEFKKKSNYDKTGRKNDIEKLKKLTKRNLDHKYKLGLFIDLGKTRNECVILTFIDGKEYKYIYW